MILTSFTFALTTPYLDICLHWTLNWIEFEDKDVSDTITSFNAKENGLRTPALLFWAVCLAGFTVSREPRL